MNEGAWSLELHAPHLVILNLVILNAVKNLTLTAGILRPAQNDVNTARYPT